MGLGEGWRISITNSSCESNIKHEGGAIFVWGCMTACDMGYVCKIKGKVTQALYLSILQDGVVKTIERSCFNLSRVIFKNEI